MFEYKAEDGFPASRGNCGEDFSVWVLRVKAALSFKHPITALIEDTVDRRVSEKALSMIISALKDNQLRSIQECETVKETWNKLQQRYTRKPIVNKLELLNNMLSTRFKQGTNIGDHVNKVKS